MTSKTKQAETMSAPKHTATPWKHGARLLTITGNGRRIAELTATEHPASEEQAHTDCAFIIRAVNAHDALVEALQELVAAAELFERPSNQAMAEARAALALAGEE